MQLLTDYLKMQQEIYAYFGYVEDWVVIPISDEREYYWYVSNGDVCYADTEQELKDQDGNYYENPIYKQRFLDKWVYRADDYTMICVDTQTDGNKFLSIFDNAKERDPYR